MITLLKHIMYKMLNIRKSVSYVLFSLLVSLSWFLKKIKKNKIKNDDELINNIGSLKSIKYNYSELDLEEGIEVENVWGFYDY